MYTVEKRSFSSLFRKDFSFATLLSLKPQVLEVIFYLMLLRIPKVCAILKVEIEVILEYGIFVH